LVTECLLLELVREDLSEKVEGELLERELSDSLSKLSSNSVPCWFISNNDEEEEKRKN
jgi:hypothetical protein